MNGGTVVVMQLTRQGRVMHRAMRKKGSPQDLSQRAGDACQMWASFLKPSGRQTGKARHLLTFKMPTGFTGIRRRKM